MRFSPSALASGPHKFGLALLAALFASRLPAWAAEKTRLRVDDYQIDAELTPHSHKISARAKVKFTALDDLTSRPSNCTTASPHQGDRRQ